MAANGILGLLFNSETDPDRIQQALQEFESSTEKLSASTSSLTQQVLLESEATEKSRQAHQGAAKAVVDHQTSLTTLADRIPTLSKQMQGELIPSLAEVGASAGSISRSLDDQLAPSFQKSGEAARVFGQAIGNAFLRATDASQGAVAAEGARLAATLGFRRVAAGIEAAWETAKGIQSLAEWDFKGAALHFMSAAEFGIIAGTSHRAHGAGTGAGYGGREPRFLNAEGREGGGRSSGLGVRSSGGGGTTVVFNVSGHLITGPETAEWMAGQLNDFVQNRDGELMSSRTKDSTLSRDSVNG